ncbi:MAG TPA: hypothetical protein VGD58_30885 [Herpetosiphonaceae bacterium]
MEHTFTKPASSISNAKSETSPIFGLYYLEEHEFDLSEVAGCFGASSVDPSAINTTTYTCPADDTDRGEVP